MERVKDRIALLEKRLAAAKELIMRREEENAAKDRRIAELEGKLDERASYVLAVTSDARTLVAQGVPDEVVDTHLKAAHDFVLKTWIETPAAHGVRR